MCYNQTTSAVLKVSFGQSKYYMYFFCFFPTSCVLRLGNKCMQKAELYGSINQCTHQWQILTLYQKKLTCRTTAQKRILNLQAEVTIFPYCTAVTLLFQNIWSHCSETVVLSFACIGVLHENSDCQSLEFRLAVGNFCKEKTP